MTYPNPSSPNPDQNPNDPYRRDPLSTPENRSYTGWIVGIIVAVIVVVGIFALRSNNPTTAANQPPAASTNPIRPAPITTGSGATAPMPPPASVPAAPSSTK